MKREYRKIIEKNYKHFKKILVYLINGYYYDYSNKFTFEKIKDDTKAKESDIKEIINFLKSKGLIKYYRNKEFNLSYEGVLYIENILNSRSNEIMTRITVIFMLVVFYSDFVDLIEGNISLFRIGSIIFYFFVFWGINKLIKQR